MINKKFRSDLAEKQRQTEKQYLDSLTIKFMLEKLELVPGTQVKDFTYLIKVLFSTTGQIIP